MTPGISICIPAYKRVKYLQRLLDSIAIQTFRDFEVVITDDSTDESVSRLIEEYRSRFSILYQKNEYQLGTPKNWNECVQKAGGHWIKLMHDDDWFTTPNSLATFAEGMETGKDFIFSSYLNVFESNSAPEEIGASKLEIKLLLKDAIVLLAKNVIGPPSVTLYRKTELEYDNRMKWTVDIDFYVHYLKEHSFHYIDVPLVNIGVNKDQVTKSSFLVPEVEIPENFLLLEKVGVGQLKNWLAYDAWWRLLRNLKIRSTDQIKSYGYRGEVPGLITGMLNDQKGVSFRLLNIGVISKVLMFISYFRRIKLNR